MVYTVEVTYNDHLRTTLTVMNCEEKRPFEFTVLLHSYFRVAARDVRVSGFCGLRFQDKLEEDEAKRVKLEKEEEVGIASEVDRIYMDVAGRDVVLVDKGKNKCPKLTVKRTGFADVVLWNPWSAKAKRMGDFGDDEFELMVCVEPGTVVKPHVLEPGATTLFAQILIPSAL